MRKKFAIVTIIITTIILPVSVVATNFSFGPTLYYEPASGNIFNSAKPEKNDFNGAISLNFNPTQHFAITENISFKNIATKDFKVEFASFYSYRFTLKQNSYIDLGLGLFCTLEKPVEGSDKVYLTFNGVGAKELFSMDRKFFVNLLGTIRPRVAIGKDFGFIGVRYEIVPNFYLAVAHLSNSDISKIIGLGKASFAILFKP